MTPGSVFGVSDVTTGRWVATNTDCEAQAVLSWFGWRVAGSTDGLSVSPCWLSAINVVVARISCCLAKGWTEKACVRVEGRERIQVLPSLRMQIILISDEPQQSLKLLFVN